MKNSLELQRDLIDIKNKVMELDDMLVELKRYMIDTIVIDSKILNNDEYQKTLDDNKKVLEELNSAINKTNTNL